MSDVQNFEFERLPEHHKRHPFLVINAMTRARRIAPHLAGFIADFLPRLPRSVRASDDLKTSTSPASYSTSLERAVCKPWVSYDSRDFRNALLLDIDHPDGLELWYELQAQIRPHLVLDPWSARAAAIFVLKTPVFVGEGAKPGPIALAEGAHKLLGAHFRAGLLPHGSLAKNPLGSLQELSGPLLRRTPTPSAPWLWEAWEASQSPLVWHLVQGAGEIELRDVYAALAELAGSLDETQTPRARKIAKGVPDQRGRNCELFWELRYWCYERVERHPGVIRDKAREIAQQFLEPLPAREIDGVARSVARYMRTYTPAVDRGVMGLKASTMELPQKQKLAALRTSSIRADKTIQALEKTIGNWPVGLKITQAAVAKAAGLSERVARKYWSVLMT